MSLYSDINTSKKDKFPKVYDIDSVSQSLENFIKTRKGQRAFRPELGCSIDKGMLFELMDDDAALLTIVRLTDDLERWDPRIIIDDRTEVLLYPDENKVIINLVYRIKGFENRVINKKIEL